MLLSTNLVSVIQLSRLELTQWFYLLFSPKLKTLWVSSKVNSQLIHKQWHQRLKFLSICWNILSKLKYWSQDQIKRQNVERFYPVLIWDNIFLINYIFSEYSNIPNERMNHNSKNTLNLIEKPPEMTRLSLTLTGFIMWQVLNKSSKTDS